MKYSVVVSAALAAVALSACDRPTVVVPSSPSVVAVPVPVPGPPGPQGAPGMPAEKGAAGPQGEKGEKGRPGSGDTIVVVPPPAPSR